MDTHLFAEDFAAVELQKTKLLINKPFFVGFTILDLAKLHMYRKKLANLLQDVLYSYLFVNEYFDLRLCSRTCWK